MLGRDLHALGHEVRYATPEGRFTIPLPTYPEIRLAMFPRPKHGERIRANSRRTRFISPPKARWDCRRAPSASNTASRSRPRSTPAFPNMCTRAFPSSAKRSVYGFLRWFHRPATAMMVATPSLKHELESHGFRNVAHLVARRGHRTISSAARCDPALSQTDLALCRPRRSRKEHRGVPVTRPAGHQGGGRRRPVRGPRWRRAYPRRTFLGPKTGEELVRGLCRAATSSSFPARPTRSGW